MLSNLKILIAATAVAGLLVTPALTKPRAHHHANPRAAYAWRSQNNYAPGAEDKFIVLAPDGKVVGRDPDINVRFELHRDPYRERNPAGGSGQ